MSVSVPWHMETRATSPGIAAKALHAAGAAGRVIRAFATGQPVLVTPEQYSARFKVCSACPRFRAGGNLGFGECTHPACGCTRAKGRFATETCPDGKWFDGAAKPEDIRP